MINRLLLHVVLEHVFSYQQGRIIFLYSKSITHQYDDNPHRVNNWSGVYGFIIK